MISSGLFLVLLASFAGCKKKERLSASTRNFFVSPAAVSLVPGQSTTLTARGITDAGPIEVNPTWSVSVSSIATLNTSIGPTVTLQSLALGDVTVAALFDGQLAIAQVAVESFQPTASTFLVYTDAGLPTGSGILSDIFAAPASMDIDELTIGYTPEGIKYQHTTSATQGQSWGVTLDKNAGGLNRDLSAYAGGTLHFALRLGRNLGLAEVIRIDVIDTVATRSFNLSSGSNGYNRLNSEWQEITIPIASFVGLNAAQVRVPFAIVMQALAGGPLTFDVDAVRWEP